MHVWHPKPNCIEYSHFASSCGKSMHITQKINTATTHRVSLVNDNSRYTQHVLLQNYIAEVALMLFCIIKYTVQKQVLYISKLQIRKHNRSCYQNVRILVSRTFSLQVLVPVYATPRV